ncbi:3'-5' exonuclease [Mycobacteroides abscessus]|uniref:3'-5' exonuclease n=1 Tax=Mycobacteroides abscessus TaxID=36809 RepID=UPI0009A70827|nr:exonuclease domain-containing protein [Mycobacteroides abscessus]SKW05220.1 Exonuclease [Mycobacteroides abscessus subsp. abscessus]
MSELWVVDVETTGLDRNRHLPVEVAAIHLKTGREIHFVPSISAEALGNADPESMRINRYYERALYRDQLSDTATLNCYQDLFELLDGKTLGGANPRFDADMLMAGYEHVWRAQTRTNEPWRYRLSDLSAYTAGLFQIDPADPPGLARCCELLGVTNTAEHTALGDTRATRDCFRRAYERDKKGIGAEPHA